MFLTAELFAATLFRRLSNKRRVVLPRALLFALIAAGALMALAPLLFVSKWLVPFVWLSYALMLDHTWTVIPADDKRAARIAVLDATIACARSIQRA